MIRYKHRLRLLDASGGYIGEIVGTNTIDGFRRITYRETVNTPGLLTVELHPQHFALKLLDADYQLEVWRYTSGTDPDTLQTVVVQPWTKRATYLFADVEITDPAQGTGVATLTCPGTVDLLAGEVVGWRSDEEGRSIWTDTAMEQVVADLINGNLVVESASTLAGRLYDAGVVGMQALAVSSSPRGLIVSTDDLSGKSVLEAIQDVCGLSAIIDVVPDGAGGWIPIFYDGYITDRREHEFSYARGNLGDVEYIEKRIGTYSNVLVGGKGDGTARPFATRARGKYSAIRHRTRFVSANGTETAVLSGVGDASLDNQQHSVFRFNPRQTITSAYGVHYNVGDLLRATYNGRSFDRLLTAAETNVSSDGASVEFEMQE